MDFKPFTEVILPPERGTGIIKGKNKEKAASPGKLPEPRQYKHPAELVLLEDDPSTETAPAFQTHVLEGKKEATAEPETPELANEEEARPESAAPEVAPETPEVAVEQEPAAVDRVDTLLLEARALRRQSLEDDRREFIISYDGRIIGEYRTTRRITNRTAFKKVAQRVCEGFKNFEIDKLELFKLVPIEIDPDTLEDVGEDCFDWFSGESQ